MEDERIEATDGVPVPQRYWAILTIALGLVLAVMDGAIANVALPTIARDVNATPAASIWVVNAYQLTVTISLLPLAAAGEIFGYRRIYQAGLVVFTVASLGCALSDSLLTLTGTRIIQGFGAAGIMSVNGALIRFIYPRRLIGRGVGLNATIGSVSSAIGPTVASGIRWVGHWPWLFAGHVPIGGLAILIAWRALPRTPRAGHKFDVASAGGTALTIGLTITAIDGLGHGQRLDAVLIELAAAIVLGFMLVARQLSKPSPLVPVDLLRIPLFALSVATSVCAFAAQGISYVSLPFLFEETLGKSQVITGLLMTPWPLTVAVIAPISGRLSDRYPAGILGGAGLAIMAGGLASLALLPTHPADLDVAWRMVLCGIGFGFFNTPNNRAIITTAPRARSGGASGMQATSRLLGQTIGAALVALVFGLAPRNGTVVTMVVAAGIAAVAALVSTTRLLDRGRPGAVE